MKKLLNIILVLSVVAGISMTGCTSAATREAIKGYNESLQLQRQAFENTHRIASEQLFVAASENIALSQNDPAKTQQTLKAAFEAKDVLTTALTQFERAQALSLVTAGQYLYDKQGFLNLLFGEQTNAFRRFTDSMTTANQAVAAPTTQPAPATPAGVANQAVKTAKQKEGAHAR